MIKFEDCSEYYTPLSVHPSIILPPEGTLLKKLLYGKDFSMQEMERDPMLYKFKDFLLCNPNFHKVNINIEHLFNDILYLSICGAQYCRTEAKKVIDAIEFYLLYETYPESRRNPYYSAFGLILLSVIFNHSSYTRRSHFTAYIYGRLNSIALYAKDIEEVVAKDPNHCFTSRLLFPYPATVEEIEKHHPELLEDFIPLCGSNVEDLKELIKYQPSQADAIKLLSFLQKCNPQRIDTNVFAELKDFISKTYFESYPPIGDEEELGLMFTSFFLSPGIAKYQKPVINSLPDSELKSIMQEIREVFNNSLPEQLRSN